MTAPIFHSLLVDDVAPLTDDSVAITFDVPANLAETFTYLAGQHITVRADIDGEDVRRSYSICANANSGVLRVGVKRIPDGRFSTWAATRLMKGDCLEVMPPVGEFVIEPTAERCQHYAAIVAGSGITPVLSHISTVLDSERASRFTLLFGNRESNTIMFLEEISALKDKYSDRFHVIHVLSREPQVVDLFHGRLDPDKLDALFAKLVDVDSVDAWYLCGPFGMVKAAEAHLKSRGVDPSTIHDELFFNEEIPDLPEADLIDVEGFATVTFTLDGRSSVVKVDPDGPSILDHALQQRRDLPFACKGGVCATCKAVVVEGEVAMDQNWALVPEEVARGLVLTCQSHPISEDVTVDFDV